MREKDVGINGLCGCWARARTVLSRGDDAAAHSGRQTSSSIGRGLAMIRAREEHSQLHIGIGWCLVRVRRA
jgi:hypothetical protein